MVIGVTGGVGTGKSTILQFLEEKFHAAVIMADDVAKELMCPGQASYDVIVDFFGHDILIKDAGDGTPPPIDRALLSKIVFQDPQKLKALESMTHPMVRRKIESLIAEHKSQGACLIVIESAILIQVGYQDLLDELWVVHTDRPVRYERLIKSRGYSVEKIDAIMRNQLTDEEMESAADFVIDNSGEPQQAWQQISQRLEGYDLRCR